MLWKTVFLDIFNSSFIVIRTASSRRKCFCANCWDTDLLSASMTAHSVIYHIIIISWNKSIAGHSPASKTGINERLNPKVWSSLYRPARNFIPHLLLIPHKNIMRKAEKLLNESIVSTITMSINLLYIYNKQNSTIGP